MPRRGMLGYLKEMRSDPLSFIQEVGPKGDVVSFRVGHRKVYGIHHPDLIKEVFLTRYESFTKTGIYARLRVAFRNSLFTSMGALWKRQRRTMQPMFAKHNMDALVDTMYAEVCQFRDELRLRCEAGEKVEMFEEMLHVTMRIIISTMFSKDIPDERDEFSRCVYVINAYAVKALYSISPPMPWLPTPTNNEYRKAFRTLDGIIQKIIDKRISRGEPGEDLLGMLLSSKDPETGEKMSIKQVREEAVTMFAAGHETTATGLAWAYYVLAAEHEVKAKMFSVIDACIENEDTKIGLQEIKQLGYVENVLSEAMRMYAPVWIIYRQVSEDLELGGVSMKAGDTIYVSPFLSGRDDKLWHDPKTCDPDRFNSAQAKERHRFAYIPFGGGPRACIGSHFSILESTMILSVLGKSFDFIPEYEREVGQEPLITLKPRDPILMRVEPR